MSNFTFTQEHLKRLDAEVQQLKKEEGGDMSISEQTYIAQSEVVKSLEAQILSMNVAIQRSEQNHKEQIDVRDRRISSLDSQNSQLSYQLRDANHQLKAALTGDPDKILDSMGDFSFFDMNKNHHPWADRVLRLLRAAYKTESERQSQEQIAKLSKENESLKSKNMFLVIFIGIAVVAVVFEVLRVVLS